MTWGNEVQNSMAQALARSNVMSGWFCTKVKADCGNCSLDIDWSVGGQLAGALLCEGMDVVSCWYLLCVVVSRAVLWSCCVSHVGGIINYTLCKS